MVSQASQGSTSGLFSAPPARAAVEVIAITLRDDFLMELGQALGGQAAVQPVESATLALERVGRGKTLQMLVVDSRDLDDLKQQIETIQTQAPQLIILVFAPSDDDKEIAAELKGTKIFAVLPQPIDAHKAAAVFGAALVEARTKQLASRHAAAAPARGAPLTVAAAPVELQQPIRPTPRDTDAGSMNPRLLILGGVVVLAIAGGAAWYFLQSDRPAPAPNARPVAATQTAPQESPAAAPAPVIETSIVTGTVDELLEKARTAMRERRYTEPNGDNALLYFRSAAAAEPGNGEAQDGLNRIAGVLAARCDKALTGSHYDEAATTLAQLKSATPKDERIAGLESRLLAARLEMARQQEDAKRRQREADGAATREAAVAERKAATARAAQAEAERQTQLARAKAEAEAKQKATEQAAKSAQPEATTQKDSAASIANYQSSVKRIRYVTPDYPTDALSRRLGGVVTIEFKIDSKGAPRDVRVLKAEPAKVFDRAAVDAVKRWRYEPLLIDGAPVEVPMHFSIRFAPPE